MQNVTLPQPTDTAEERTRPFDVRLGAISQALKAPGIKALSIDVFDTLVWRQVPEPVDAFRLIARRLRERESLSPELTDEAFGRLREAAEAHAREQRGRFAPDGEVRLDEIYDLLPSWVFADRSAAFSAAEIELEVERELIVPDLDVVELLAEAQRRGKLLIAVSDTYFSAPQLRLLFQQPVLGRLQFDEVFTSSDHRANKSGELFPIMLNSMGLEPSQVLHLGDNVAADVGAPAALGIGVHHFERRPEPYKSVVVKEHRFAPEHSADAAAVTASALTAARTKVLARRERAETPVALQRYWDYGATVLGPVFTGYAEWVHHQCQRRGIGKALCLMREGTFLKELIDGASAYLGGDLETVPLWVNRRLCLRAGLAEIDQHSLVDLMARRTPPSVGTLLRTLGIDPSAVPRYAGQLHTSLEDPVVRELLVEHLRETPHLRLTVLENARRLRERIVGVVDRAAPGDEPLLLVDLGWGATIQGYLGTILRDSGRSRHTVGLYLLTHEGATRQVLRGAEVHGFLGDFGFPSRFSDLVMRSPELLEQICMPEHGTQLEIDENLDPVLDDALVPELQRVEAETVRRGIRAFQREWARYHVAMPGKIGTLHDAPRQLRPILLRSVIDPTSDEVAAFGSWQHDAGHGEEVDAIADNTAIERLRYLDPAGAHELPMNELYWPFALLAQADEHWPALLAAAAAGEIPWEAMSAPLDTGRFVVQATGGVDSDAAMSARIPTRNRLGLSCVRSTIRAAQISELTLTPTQFPALLRVDRIQLRFWAQGEAEPLTASLDGEAGLRRFRRANCFLLAPNVLIVHGGAPQLAFDVRTVTSRVVSRIDVEVAFAAISIGDVLPAGGRFPDIEEAGRQYDRIVRELDSIRGSAVWRYSAPLRAAKKRWR